MFTQKEVDKIANGYLEETTKKLQDAITEKDSVINRQNAEIRQLSEDKIKLQ